MDTKNYKQQAAKLLKDIGNAIDHISFKNSDCLANIADIDIKRSEQDLVDVQDLHRNATQHKDSLKNSIISLQKKLEKLDEKKNKTLRLSKKLENEYLQFSNRTEKNMVETNILKAHLNTYKEVSGVHFNYKGNKNVVSGFIGVKGETPEESELLPFSYDVNDPDISAKIWEKIKEASGFISETQDIHMKEID